MRSEKSFTLDIFNPHPLRVWIEFLSEQGKLRNSGAWADRILIFNKTLQI